jgi:hypothetical protein
LVETSIEEELEVDEEDIAVFKRVVQQIIHPHQPLSDLRIPQTVGSITEAQSPAPSITSDLSYMDSHPLVREYLAKLVDLDLLQECLDDLFNEKQRVEELRKIRLRLGLTVNLDEQSWLDNSQKKLRELDKKIDYLRVDLESIKQECIIMELMDKSGEPINFHTQEQLNSDREDIDPQNETPEYTKYPLLLPRPGLKNKNSGSYVSKLESSDTTSSRINQWMLEKLRTSVLDVRLLANTFEGFVGETDDRWQADVLSFWYKDGTIESTTANPALSLDLSA